MDSIEKVIANLIKFRDERNWSQFHDSKNLALAISIEAAELNELFLWKDAEQSETVDKQKIKDELADILSYSFLLADKHGFNIEEIVLDKIKRNEARYPISKAKGNAKKHNEL